MVKPNGSQAQLKEDFKLGILEFEKGMILTLWDSFYYTKNDLDMFKWISMVETRPSLLDTPQLKKLWEMIQQIRIPAETVENNKVFEALKTNPTTNLQKFNTN